MSDAVVAIVSAFFIIGITTGIIAVVALSALRSGRPGAPGAPGEPPESEPPQDPGWDDPGSGHHPHWPGE